MVNVGDESEPGVIVASDRGSRQSSLPSAVRSPRPIICTNNISDLVGRARMMQRTSQSMPVVRQPTLQTTLISPAMEALGDVLRARSAAV